MGTISLIYFNSASGNASARNRQKKLEAILANDGKIYPADNPDHITKTVKSILRHSEVQVLAVCGEDSGFQAVFTAVMESCGSECPLLLAPLPSNVTTALGRSLELYGTPEERLAWMVDKTSRQESFVTRKLPILKLSSPERVQYGFMFGSGAPERFVNSWKESPFEGNKAAIGALIKSFAPAFGHRKKTDRSFQKDRLDIEIEGFKIPLQEFTGVLAGTLPKVALGFRPLYRTGDFPDTFQVLAGDVEPFSLLKNLPWLHSGRRMKGRNIYDFTAKDVRISGEDSFSYMLDGRSFSTQRVRITSGVTPEVIIG